ncbi:MAG: HDIG domain-containing protein, partial [Clostridia bacterium]|nr:HDIG domain-containing protein [Clostridia bacterium]
GLFFLLVIVFILIGVYMSIFVTNVFTNPSLLLLMGIVIIITLILSVAATYFSSYLMPVAMGIILLTVLFGYKLAVIINLVLALMVGLITGGDFSFILVALLGGLVSIYAVTRLSQRSDLARAGFYVAITNAAVILSAYLFFGNVSLEYDSLVSLGYSMVAGIGNGILSAVVAIGLLPFLESIFGVTTAITLLELSNPNHPLLRKMLLKAPGTYYHSMMVSNLAETAAEAVNADALLTRVGAYYHDIGKLKRPYFFSENQLSGENPHSKLSPNLSALIIGVHPKDGGELGRKHRLPEAIVDIAVQHHGNSMISFFYQLALENDCRENVSADMFRYEGPKPQTKEATIIMLADAVEAGIRSLSKPSGNRVETMIRRMIKEKLDDGQLDQCDLTLKEIDQIAEAFIYIMSGIYHSRIEYPEKDLKAELERSVGLK